MVEKTNLKTIVCLANLGTISQLNLKAIRFFLGNFLSDKRVVNLPRWLWYPILFLIILPFRAQKLKKKYQSIALDEKKYPHFSPLMAYSQNISKKLQQNNQDPNRYYDYAMTYIEKQSGHNLTTIFKTYQNKYDRFLLFPLYPHFSFTTTCALTDQLLDLKRKNKSAYKRIELIKSYALEPIFIDTIAKSIQDNFALNDPNWHLLFSYHSIPLKVVQSGDSYPIECQKSTQLIIEKLKLAKNRAHLSYQSRFGKAKWLTPATDAMAIKLAQKKIKKIAVICPGFSMDCLETLEEINQELRQTFLDHAGEKAKFKYIPCLNDSEQHCEMIKKIITKKLALYP